MRYDRHSLVAGPDVDPAPRAAARAWRRIVVAARGSSWRTLATVALPIGGFAALLALLASRRLGSLQDPQFWAEDGGFWYAEAYNEGAVAPLLRPVGGYLQTFAKAIAAASLTVDLAHAPLFFTLAALSVQAVTALFLLSQRFAAVVPGRGARIALALLLVALPNAAEVHGNVTTSHIHLALLSFLILVADDGGSRAWRAFDVVFLLLSGLSGPFCVFLLPVAIACWLRTRSPWDWRRLLVLLVPTVIQAGVLVSQLGRARHNRIPLGASVQGALEIVGGQVVVAGLVGEAGYAELSDRLFRAQPMLLALVGLCGLVFVAAAVLRTRSFALRALAAFAALHLAASLGTPMIYGRATRWQLLQTPGAGQRYYVFATVTLLCALVSVAATDRSRALRAVAGALLALLVLVGVPLDWRHAPFASFDFPTQVERFRAAPAGELVVIPIPPAKWTVRLVKH